MRWGRQDKDQSGLPGYKHERLRSGRAARIAGKSIKDTKPWRDPRRTPPDDTPPASSQRRAG